MNSGQTILTIAAFALLSTVLLNFYRLMGYAGADISKSQDGILLTTIAASYIEVAQGLAFDEYSDTCHVPLTNVGHLTSPGDLGRETGNDSLEAFNDIDDFNNYTVEKTIAGTSLRRFKTTFTVHYVDSTNVENISYARTFVKRLDMKTWRTFPPSGDDGVDTLRASFVMGYFHFD